MGACYSKSGASASLSPPEKAPGLRKRLSWRSKKRDRDSSSVSREAESLVGSRCSPEKAVMVTPSRPSPVEVDPLLAEKQVEERESKLGTSSLLQATVAPSDSGIESIGTVQEDSQDQQGTQLPDDEQEVVELKLRRKDHKTAATSANAEESDSSSADEASVYLSRQLQRLSRGSCHKCGNFKLDDSALTALLADTYCICGPRRAGKPSVNPQCQTHGLRHQRSTLSSHGDTTETATDNVTRDQTGADQCTKVSLSCDFSETNTTRFENMQLKSSLKKGRSGELLEEGRGRRVSLKSEEESSALAYQNNLDDVFEDGIDKEKDSSQALWNHIGSIDKSLESFSLPAQQRRSLLSEILDITNSICHCDFYSNEIYCSTQDQQELEEDISKSVQCVITASSAQQQFSDEAISKSTPVLYPPHIRKYLGSSKNVSFAKENESKSFATPDISTPKSPLSKGRQQIGKLERLSSVESIEGIVVSGSSSEEDVSNGVKPRDGNDVERTGAAQRSLTYNSVQQLVGNSRELTGSVCSARRMLIDGCDSVVIPTEVYCQLEADLSTMKEQLQYLTSLMLEDQDEETTMYESDELEESFA